MALSGTMLQPAVLRALLRTVLCRLILQGSCLVPGVCVCTYLLICLSLFTFMFWDKVSQWTWDSPIQVDWLTSSKNPVCAPAVGVTDVCCHAQLFTWALGSTQVLMLCASISPRWLYLPAQHWAFYQMPGQRYCREIAVYNDILLCYWSTQVQNLEFLLSQHKPVQSVVMSNHLPCWGDSLTSSQHRTLCSFLFLLVRFLVL